MFRRFLQSKYTLLSGILLIAALLKLGLLLGGSLPFNADEAVVGLMARHILAGERPIFFYGQAYMGSLDAYFIAGGFAIFGQQVWVIRFVQGLLYLGVLITTFWLGETAFHSTRTGLLAAALLAIPAVNVTLYTTVSLGGYGEALLIGNCIFLIALRIAKFAEREKPLGFAEVYTRWGWIGIFGLLSGFGLWTNGLTLVYTFPAVIFVARSLWRQPGCITSRSVTLSLFVYTFGFLLGSLPWWIYAFYNGFGALLGELLGEAIAVEGGSYLGRTALHFINLIILGIPAIIVLRPPWEVRWLALPLAPVALAFWIGASGMALRQVIRLKEKQPGYLLWWGVIVCLVLGFLFTPFGVDPSGRYFLPIGVALAFFGAELLSKIYMGRKGLAILLVTGILVFNFSGTLQSALRNPPGLTTQFNPETLVNQRYYQDLAAFLEANGETRGYTTYWVSYPLAFLSKERLIFIPRLPYHNDLRYTYRDDRYLPYQNMVVTSPKAAYITVNHPILNDLLRDAFRKADIQWDEKIIGDFQVFYHVSGRIDQQYLESLFSDQVITHGSD